MNQFFTQIFGHLYILVSCAEWYQYQYLKNHEHKSRQCLHSRPDINTVCQYYNLRLVQNSTIIFVAQFLSKTILDRLILLIDLNAILPVADTEISKRNSNFGL